MEQTENINPSSNNKTIWIYGSILAVSIILVAGIVVSRNEDNIDENNLPEGSSVTVINESQLSGGPQFNDNEGSIASDLNDPSVSSDLRQFDYRDGTYSTRGSYTSPAGSETIEVVVRIEKDTITDVTLTPQATNPTSIDYQERYSRGIGEVVNGKKIDEIEASKVNGSTLTANGFIQALDKIKAEAAVE
jgi:uncharacterized protein with FMN-binding domain